MIKEDERLASCVAHTCFDVDVGLPLGSAVVEYAEIRRADSAVNVLQDLNAPNVPARPIQFNVIRFQDLAKVPSQRSFHFRQEPMANKALAFATPLPPYEENFDVVETTSINLA